MPNDDLKTTDETEAKTPDGGGFAAPPCSESIAIALDGGAVAHVSPDAQPPLIDALGRLVRAAREHFSPHARFARRLREIGNDARTERMHILADVCDEMAEKLEADSCIPNTEISRADESVAQPKN